MKLKRLELANFRVFEQVTFDFQPGMNLLVGINGAGKSSALDALRTLLSHALQEFTAFRDKRRSFEIDDIMIGRDGLITELHFESGGFSASQLMREQREEYIPVKKQEGQVRGQTYDIGENRRFTVHEGHIPKDIKSAPEQPLAVYFSTRRSFPNRKAPNKRASAGGQTAAFAGGLLHRQLRIREFAEWWLVQQTLSQERANPRLEFLANAVKQFLEDYTNLRAVGDLAIPFTWDSSRWDTEAKYDGGPPPTLLLDKNDMTLDVRQLSDGERGLLALVFDLARRLSLANPELDNPLRDGKAVVLIDELDLHLHPRWQRTVVEKLTKTFPNCQFIATTHSPQVIGEVSPDKIILLESGQPPDRPYQSLGMDSNWVLRHLMDTGERDSKIKQELRHIDDLIEEEQYDKATIAIEVLRSGLGEFPELVRLQTRIDRIRLLEE